MPRKGGKTWRSIRNKVKRVVCRLEGINTKIDGVVDEVRGLLGDIDNISKNCDEKVSETNNNIPGDTQNNYVHSGKNTEIDSCSKPDVPVEHDVSGKEDNKNRRFRKRRSLHNSIETHHSLVFANDSKVSSPRFKFNSRNESYFRRKARSVSDKSLLGATDNTGSQTTLHKMCSTNDFHIQCHEDVCLKTCCLHCTFCRTYGINVESKIEENISCYQDHSDTVNITSMDSKIQCDNFYKINLNSYIPTRERLNYVTGANAGYTKNDLLLRYFNSLPCVDELDPPQLDENHTNAPFASTHTSILSEDTHTYLKIRNSTMYPNGFTSKVIPELEERYTQEEHNGYYEGDFEARLETVIDNLDIIYYTSDDDRSLINASLRDLACEHDIPLNAPESPCNTDVNEEKYVVHTHNSGDHTTDTYANPNGAQCNHSDAINNETLLTNLRENERYNTEFDSYRGAALSKFECKPAASKSPHCISGRYSLTESDEQKRETGYNTQDTTPVDGCGTMELDLTEIGHRLTEWTATVVRDDKTSNETSRGNILTCSDLSVVTEMTDTHVMRNTEQYSELVEQICVTI